MLFLDKSSNYCRSLSSRGGAIEKQYTVHATTFGTFSLFTADKLVILIKWDNFLPLAPLSMSILIQLLPSTNFPPLPRLISPIYLSSIRQWTICRLSKNYGCVDCGLEIKSTKFGKNLEYRLTSFPFPNYDNL